MGRRPRTDPFEQVHNRTVGYLERGEYSPSLVLALRIARLLETPVGDLSFLDPVDTSTTDHRSTTDHERADDGRDAAQG